MIDTDSFAALFRTLTPFLPPFLSLSLALSLSYSCSLSFARILSLARSLSCSISFSHVHLFTGSLPAFSFCPHPLALLGFSRTHTRTLACCITISVALVRSLHVQICMICGGVSMPVHKSDDAVRRMCLHLCRSVCQRVCVCMCVCLCAVCGSTLLCAEFGRGVVAAAHVAHPHCSSMPLFSSIIYSHTIYKHAHTHVHAWVGVWVSDVYICDRLFLHAYSITKRQCFMRVR